MMLQSDAVDIDVAEATVVTSDALFADVIVVSTVVVVSSE
jgi:hypothetical protein